MTKKEAILKANEMRSAGRCVKVVRVSGVYTQPGRGLIGYSHYEVRPVAVNGGDPGRE
jgi:hypothetical protein